MPDKDKSRRWVYDQLVSKGVNMGNYDAYYQAMDREEARKWVYQKAVSTGVPIGDEPSFHNALSGPQSMSDEGYRESREAATGKEDNSPRTEGRPGSGVSSWREQMPVQPIGQTVPRWGTDKLREYAQRNQRPAVSSQKTGQSEQAGQQRGDRSEELSRVMDSLRSRYAGTRLLDTLKKAEEERKENAEVAPLDETRYRTAQPDAQAYIPSKEAEQEIEKDKEFEKRVRVTFSFNDLNSEAERKVWEGRDRNSDAETMGADAWNMLSEEKREQIIADITEAIKERNPLGANQQWDEEKLRGYAEDIARGEMTNRMARYARKANTGETAARRQVSDLSNSIDEQLRQLRQQTGEEWKDEGGVLRRMGKSLSSSNISGFPQRTTLEEIDYKEKEDALLAAKRMLTNAQRMIAEADHNAKEGKFESTFAAGVGRGLGQKFSDASTWDMGGTEFMDNSLLLKALQDYEDGKELTASQQALLDAKAVELATSEYFASKVGRGYKAGEVTAEAVPFMLEMILNPAAGIGKGAEKAMIRWAVKRFGAKAVKKGASKYAARKAAQLGGRILGDIGAATALTATSGATRTAADAVSRMTGDVQFDTDEIGNIVFDGRDKNTAEDVGAAFRKAFLNTTIENYSEMMGEYFAPLFGIVGRGASSVATSKVGRKFWLDQVDDFVKSVGSNDITKMIVAFEKKANWHGSLAEWAEEISGGALNAMFVGDQKIVGKDGKIIGSGDEQALFNKDSQIDTFLGVALMGGVFSTMKTAGYIGGKQHYAHKVKKADAVARWRLDGFDDAVDEYGNTASGKPRRWPAIKQRIDDASNTDMQAVVEDILNDDTLRREEKEAVLDYVRNTMSLRGYNIRKEVEENETVGNNNTDRDDADGDVGVPEAFSRGYDASAEERRDIAIELAMADENNRGERQAAYDGMLRKIEDDADYQAAQEREEMRKRQHKDGTVRPVTIKELDSDGNEKTVFLVDGDVVMSPDGSDVDIALSDITVIVYDPSTGGRRMIDPTGGLGVKAVGAVMTQEAFESDLEQRRQAYVQRQIDEANGKLNVTVGELFTLDDERQGVVMAVNGDDVTVMLEDGSEETVSLSEMQRLADEAAVAEYKAKHGNENENPSGNENENPSGNENEKRFVAGKPEQIEQGTTLRVKMKDEETGEEVEREVLATGVRMSSTAQGWKEDSAGRFVEVIDPTRDDEVLHIHENDITGYETPGEPSATGNETPEPSATGNETPEPSATGNEMPGEPGAHEDVGVPGEGVSAMPMRMVGKGKDKHEEEDWMATTPERAYRYLYEEAVGMGLSIETANNIVENNLKKAQNAVKKAMTATGSVVSVLQKQNAAKAEVEYWEQVKRLRGEAMMAESAAEAERTKEQRAAEAARREALRAERRNTAAGEAGLAPGEKYNAANKIDGNKVSRTIADGTKIRGRFVLVEADALTPSHDPFNGWKVSEGFPTTEDGSSVNDRVYESDKGAQEFTEAIAREYDGQAVSEIPVVSSEGIVYDGNGRTMAGQIAAHNDTDAAYIESLMENAANFGFTEEQVKLMSHPRVVMQVDENLPYNATTFARFNKESKKKMDSTNKAVSVGKQMTDAARDAMLEIIDRYGTIDTFFASEKAATDVVKMLVDGGFITRQEIPAFTEKNSEGKEILSAEGRSFVTNTMLGTLFDEEAIRKLGNDNGLKQSLMRAIPQIAENRRLGDYALTDEINTTINLLYEARRSGMRFDVFLRQGNLIEGLVQDRYEPIVILMAEEMSSGVDNFRNVLTLYNKSAVDEANSGGISLFEPRTREDIKRDVVNYYKKQSNGYNNQPTGTGTETGKTESKETGSAVEGPQGSDGDRPGNGERRTESGEPVAGERSPVAEAIARQEVNDNPTEGQKEAGNYKKAHVRVDGFDVTIENKKGGTRSGVDADGHAWSQTMNNNYGYILGTEGVDGDHIDVFLSDTPEQGGVFVVDQVDPKTGEFDEHKVMYGFGTAEEAREAYLANYEPGWLGLGVITAVSKEEFKKWVESSHRKTKPFAEYKSVKVLDEEQAEVDRLASQLDEGNTPHNDEIIQQIVDLNTEASERWLDENVRGQKGDGAAVEFTPDQKATQKALDEMLGGILGKDYVVDAEEGQRVLDADMENRARLMGTKVERRKKEIAAAIQGQNLTPEQQVVVDVFVGNKNSDTFSVTDKTGQERDVKMRQGQELKAGTKHSIYRHYKTTSNGYTADEILLIPEIIAQGDRKQNGKDVSYSMDINGIRYTVTTEQSKIGNETFTNFYTNRNSAAVANGTSNTANQHAPQQSNFGAKLQKFSDIQEKSPIFYSNAAKAVEDIKQEKATPEQWLKMIEKAGGLKSGEDKWIGLSEWLEESGKRKAENGKPVTLTKQEVLDYIRENQIEIEEVEYDDMMHPERIDAFVNLVREYEKIVNRMAKDIEFSHNETEDDAKMQEVFDNAFAELRDEYRGGDDFDMAFSHNEFGELEINDEDLAAYFLGETKPIDETRLSYTTDFLDNKREIALTVPSIEPWNEDDKVHFGDAGEGRAVAWVRFGETTVTRDFTKEEMDVLRERNAYLDELREKYGEDYVPKLTEEENKKLHDYQVKIQEINNNRTQRVLVIDEIQSKRHQEGREKGYKRQMPIEGVHVGEYVPVKDKKYADRIAFADVLEHDDIPIGQIERIDGKYRAIGSNGQNVDFNVYDTEAEAVNAVKNAYATIEGIPDAPFDKNWHEVAMKRMLRYAAENGYDKIAWTTGEQQAERYDLGNKISDISVSILDDGTRLVTLNFRNRAEQYDDFYQFSVNDDGRVVSGDFADKELSDVVGKEMSKKIMSTDQPSTKFSGEDLRVGAEGMKGFYDQILPRFMDKYGKKWGVKTEEVQLPNVGDNGLTMWSVDVTPEMKASVMEGQQMFFKGEDGEVLGYTVNGKIYIDPRVATTETRVHEYSHLWAQALRKANPKAWEKLKEEMMSLTKLVDYVRNKYPELDGANGLNGSNEVSDEFVEEVFAHYSGKRGAERLESDMREAMAAEPDLVEKAGIANMFHKLRDLLKKFWTMARDLFAGKVKGVEKLTAEDFADMTLNDLLNGFDPRGPKGGKKAEKAEEKTLMGVHNISEEKLKKALKRGGFANPSMAVIDTKKGGFDSYGDISLIPKASLIDSSTGRNAGTYGGDAWTPTYPNVEYYEGKETEKRLKTLTAGLPQSLGEYIRRRVSDYMDKNYSTSGLEYLFLKEHGIDMPIVHNKRRYPNISNKEIHDRIGVSENIYGSDLYREYEKMPQEQFFDFNLWLDKYGDEAEIAKVNDMIARLRSEGNDEAATFLIDRYSKPMTFANFDSHVYNVGRDEREAGSENLRATLENAAMEVDKQGLRNEFDAWQEKQIDDLGYEERLFAGYTPSGNRRYLPNTLENASRLMNKESDVNAYDNTSLNATRAALMYKMQSLDDIRKHRDLLQKGDGYDKSYKEMSDKMLDVAHRLSDMRVISDNPLMNTDYAIIRMQDAFTKKDPIGYLNKEYGYSIDKDGEFAKDMLTFMDEVKDMPVKYFETKFKRPVMLDEFAVAVVPEGTSEDVVKALQNAGLDVRTYDGTPENRKDVTLEAVRGRDDIMFQKTKAEDITSEENIAHGLDALQQLADGAEEVRGAMKRKDLAQHGGDENITFYFGKEGDASKDYKKGYGIAHIGAKHGKDAIIRAINIIANGKFERYVPGNKTVVLTDGEYETVLALTRFGNKETWLFNGWKKKENTGDNGEVSTASVSTQNSPTFSRADLGAVVSAAKIQNNSETAKNNLQNAESEDGVLFRSLDPESDNIVDNAEVGTRPLSDREKVAKLEAEPKEKVFRSMQLIDGKLYPPMSAKVDGQLREPSELGVWEEADEAPDMADENGKFKLDKGNKKSLKAAYNPYIHTSRTMLNDQFSEAQDRPNLVVVEMEVPESELTSGYKAEKAKDSVGAKQWKAGVIQGQLSGTREVILSRWAKPVRIVPDNEVAQNIYDQIKGQVDVMPSNVVTPQVRAELEKLGVKFVETDNTGKIVDGEFKGRTWASVYGKKAKGMPMREAEYQYRMNPYYPYKTYEESLAASKRAGYTKAQHDAMVERRRKRPERWSERIKEHAEKLNMGDRVEVHLDGKGLRGRYAKARGWFDPKTGKIHIVIDKHSDYEDVVKTLLHEGVTHYGLRQLFGERFKDFLDTAYKNASKEIRERIVELSKKHGWNVRTATEEYLAQLAEDTEFEKPEVQSWWHKVKELFHAMLQRLLGNKRMEGVKNVELTDNELRYILWTSYENMKEPGRYDWVREAQNIAKREELGVNAETRMPTLAEFERQRKRFAIGKHDVRTAGESKAHWESYWQTVHLLESDKMTLDEAYEIQREIYNEAKKTDMRSERFEELEGMMAALEPWIDAMEEWNSYNGVAEEEPVFRDGEEEGGNENQDENERKGLRERITETKVKAAAMNKDDVEKRNEAVRAIGANLSDLRKAMGMQREYDRGTVKRVSDLAQVLMENGYLSELGKGEVKRLMSAIKNATGKEDTSKEVQTIMDVMVDNMLRRAKSRLQDLEKVRGSKIDAKGVEVQGALDVKGQTIIKVFKDARSMDLKKIEEHLLEAENRMGSDNVAVAEEATLEYAGLQAAKEYAENIKTSEEEESELRGEIKNYDGPAESKREFVASVEEAIRQNKVERIEAYQALSEKLAEMMRGSIERALNFKESDKERIREIQHNANSDMEGRPSDEHYQPTWKDKIMNNAFAQVMFSPLATFDQMLRLMGRKSANGEGYLYNRFMRGWVDAREKEIRGVRKRYAELDKKVAEIFGTSRIKTMGELIRATGKMPKMMVEFWNGGEMKPHELTQGNMMYIYMVDKMDDGRMKLRRMGIDEEAVEAITEKLDSRLRELADWIQNEFLVDTRNEYNETHKRVFGANMAAIEHYFPLKILGNALIDKPEDLDNPNKNDVISTTTGSIIKRRRNALALDVLGANALSVVLDHVAQMEHWNAFAEFNRDLNTLRTYKHFRNQVKNMTTIYGSGDKLWKKFNDVSQMAAGTYRPPRAMLDEAAVNIAKGVTAAKVSFRVFTALKQFLSSPAYISEARPDLLAANLINPVKAWRWGMANLPIFEERWKSRMAGDPRLMKSELDWKAWRNNVVQIASRIGMSPNAFVDALTVSIGAHSIYQTKKSQYLRDGYSEEQAEQRAKQDAEVAYNQTQQSSEGAFLSTMQVDRSWLSVMLTVFRNASMAYTRQLWDAMRNLKHNLTPSGRTESIEFMTKQLIRDGVDEATAERSAKRKFRRQIRKDVTRVAVFGYILQLAWNLGPYIPYLLFGDDDDEKQKMWDDVWAHTAFGSIEGLTGGDVMSAAGNMMLSGEGNPAYLAKDMPLTSDVLNILKKIGKSDSAEVLSDVVNLVVQMGIGVNPQSITDAVLAVMDACGDDPALAKEATICVMRILQVPQSQIKKLYFDEIGLSGEEVSEYTPMQLVERYARYQVKRGRFFALWLWDDEEAIGKKKEQAMKAVKERMEKMGDAAVNAKYEELSASYADLAELEKAYNKARKKDYVEAALVMAEIQQEPERWQAYQRFKQTDKQLDKLAEKYLKAETVAEAEKLLEEIINTKKEITE